MPPLNTQDSARRRLAIADQWLWDVVLPYAQAWADAGGQGDEWRAMLLERTPGSARRCRGNTAEALYEYLCIEDRDAFDVLAVGTALVAEAITIAWSERLVDVPRPVSPETYDRIRIETVATVEAAIDRDGLISRLTGSRASDRFMEGGP